MTPKNVADTPATVRVARYRVPTAAPLLDMLEATEDRVRIRGTPYRRFTLRGVPGREADVIVAERILADRAAAVVDVTDQRPQKLPPANQDVVIDLGNRAGHYDRAIRRRYAVRHFTAGPQLDAIERANIRVVPDGDRLIVMIQPHGSATAHVDTFRRLKSDLRDYQMGRIWSWHYWRYYRFLGLEPEDVIARAKSWEAIAEAEGRRHDWTLAEANRAASRDLYRLARDLGWCKLTAREKDALGIPVHYAQWQRSDEIGALRAEAAGILPADPMECGWDEAGRLM